jgi:hypothetical protein
MQSLVIYLLLLSVATKAQTAGHIVSNYIDFIGGEKKWKKITSMISTGEYDYGGVAFPFTTYAKAPNRYKFIVTFNGKYYAQAYNGTSGWRIDAFKNETAPTLLEGKPARAMANEADIEFQSPFINYKTKSHSITFEGNETIAGIALYKIKLLRKSGESETYYFDTKNFSLVMKIATAKNVELQGASLNTYYSDYRTVQGLNIPFNIVSKANEQTVLTISVKEVMLNVEIRDAEFKAVK